MVLCLICSSKKNKDVVDGKCSPVEPKSPAMIRAEEVQSNLEPQFPSFAKSMVRSHVASCFWMVSSVRYVHFNVANGIVSGNYSFLRVTIIYDDYLFIYLLTGASWTLL